MCGAVLAQVDAALAQRGSSPRVRSGPAPPARRRPGQRIISACAERSVLRGEVAVLLVDHLRVCGAVSATVASKALNRGSSPRVRSGRMPGHVPVMDHRIISACAERSVAVMVISRLSRDHLRVCGAVSCILLGFGPVGWCGMFDSYVVRSRGVALFSIFGMDAFDICYAR